jgi:hypothetical protein
MPAQSTRYGDPTAGFSDDLKDRAPQQQFDRIATRTTDKLRTVAGQAEHFANRLSKQGRAAGGKVQNVAGKLQGCRRQIDKGPTGGDACHGSRSGARPRSTVEILNSS